MTAPDSSTETFEKILKNPVQLPDYQRDFAWDSKKMNQLWEDLTHYLFKNPQQSKSTNAGQQFQYFLGAIPQTLETQTF